MPCLPFLQVTNQTTILLEDSLHLNGLIYLVCRNKEFTKKGIKQILWIMAAIIREHDEESISREQEEASHKQPQQCKPVRLGELLKQALITSVKQ